MIILIITVVKKRTLILIFLPLCSKENILLFLKEISF